MSRHGLLCLIAVGAALVGCAGPYGCKGLPDDPICLSAVDAYHATERTPPHRTGAAQPTAPKPAAATAHARPSHSTTRPFVPAPNPRIDDPAPIRTPSKVLRIWIAPWEDAEGDLQVSGYVFTELEPRRWVVGLPAAPVSPTLTPLQVVHRQPETAQRRAVDKYAGPSVRPTPLYGAPDDEGDDD